MINADAFFWLGLMIGGVCGVPLGLMLSHGGKQERRIEQLRRDIEERELEIKLHVLKH